MAVYVFKCVECNKTSEISMNISEYIKEIKETKSTSCPHCGKVANLIPTITDFQLKGSGWYVTDYKNQPGKKEKS